MAEQATPSRRYSADNPFAEGLESGPWEKYQRRHEEASRPGPWTKYRDPEAPWKRDPVVQPQADKPWLNDPEVKVGRYSPNNPFAEGLEEDAAPREIVDFGPPQPTAETADALLNDAPPERSLLDEAAIALTGKSAAGLGEDILGIVEGEARPLQIGAQGVGRGLADTAGLPVDLMTLLINAASGAGETVTNWFLDAEDEITTPAVRDPAGGSENLSDLAGEALRAMGVDLIPQEEMTDGERMAYSVNRFGTQGVVAGAPLARAGARAVANAGPRARPSLGELVTGSMRRPYEDATVRAAGAKSVLGEAVEGARPLAYDAAAGAGSGVGAEAADRYDLGPLATFAATTAGGVGGATALGTATSPASMAQSARNRFMSDPDIPPGPTGSMPSRATGIEARRALQESADNPRTAAERIRARTSEYRDADMTPPASGALSDDEGLIALERGARQADPVPFARRDRQVAQSASDQIESLDPGPNARARDATEYVTRDVRGREAAARDRVAAARQQAEAAEAAERQMADNLAANRGTGEAASEQIDAAVRQTLETERAAKNVVFDAIDPDGSVMRPIDPLAEAAREVVDSIGALAPEGRVLPRQFVRKIEAMVPRIERRAVDTGVLDEAGQPVTKIVEVNVGGPGEVSFQDINSLRAPLSDAISQARANNQGALVRSLERLKSTVDGEVARLAEEGGDAASRAQSAIDRYRSRYAPAFVEGEGGRYRRDLARDRVQPTKTAGRFLRAGPGSKETANDLRRIAELAENSAEATGAARQYLLDSLSGTVGADGRISLPRLRAWRDQRRGALDAFPEIRNEIDTMVRDAVNGREASTRMQRQLEDAVGAMKRTEREIQSSALSLLIDADPQVAVRGVFNARDPQAAMREIVARVKGDKAASAGWKKAVAEHLEQAVTGGNSAKTAEAGRPVSLDRLRNLVDRNAETLAEVYSPDEMLALRRAHMAAEDLARSALPTGARDASLQDMANVMRVSEIGLKLGYGGLRGGNLYRNLKLALASIPGLDSNAKVAAVIRQAMLDPDLAAHLLVDTVPPAKRAAWSKKLTGLIGLGEAARENAAED